MEIYSRLQFWPFAFSKVLAKKMSGLASLESHREVYQVFKRLLVGITMLNRTFIKWLWLTPLMSSSSRSQKRETRFTMTSWAFCIVGIRLSQGSKEKSSMLKQVTMVWHAENECWSSGAYHGSFSVPSIIILDLILDLCLCTSNKKSSDRKYKIRRRKRQQRNL